MAWWVPSNADHEGPPPMGDVIFVAVILAFFGLMMLIVRWLHPMVLAARLLPSRLGILVALGGPPVRSRLGLPARSNRRETYPVRYPDYWQSD